LFEEVQNPIFLQNSDMFENLKKLDEIEVAFNKMNASAEKYGNWQNVLEQQPTIFENLEDCREQLSLRCMMWRNLNEWQEKTEIWKKTPFQEIDSNAIAKEADKYWKNVMRLEKNLPPNPVQEQLKAQVETFKDAMPIVKSLRNKQLEENHWTEIQTLIQKPIDINNPDFTLKSLIELDVNQYVEDIVAISTAATQEYNLRQQMASINQKYKELKFI
jgi:dynein heavy chain